MGGDDGQNRQETQTMGADKSMPIQTFNLIVDSMDELQSTTMSCYRFLLDNDFSTAASRVKRVKSYCIFANKRSLGLLQ
jgi:hypothetical protein